MLKRRIVVKVLDENNPCRVPGTEATFLAELFLDFSNCHDLASSLNKQRIKVGILVEELYDLVMQLCLRH